MPLAKKVLLLNFKSLIILCTPIELFTVKVIHNSMAVPLNEIIQINQGVLLIQANQINTKNSIEAIILMVTQLWWMVVSKTLQLRLTCYLVPISYFRQSF